MDKAKETADAVPKGSVGNLHTPAPRKPSFFLLNPQIIFDSSLAWSVGIILSGAFLWCRRLVQLHPSRRMWRPLLARNNILPIAVPSIQFSDFAIEWNSDPATELPPNVTLVGLYDGIGVADLQARLRQLFPRRKFELASASSFSSFNSSFITIGGSSVNRVTYALLEERELDATFSVIYPEHIALCSDPASGEVVEYCPIRRELDGAITRDYGFILMTENPFNPRQRVCVLQGVWTFGTWAAVYSMLHPKDTGLYARFKRMDKKAVGFLAVVEVEVVEDVPAIPRVVELRAVSPQ